MTQNDGQKIKWSATYMLDDASDAPLFDWSVKEHHLRLGLHTTLALHSAGTHTPGTTK